MRHERHIRITYQKGFNPRTPCGVRHDEGQDAGTVFVFQSTHSLRSATPIAGLPDCSMWFQSTHSLRSATCQSCQGRQGRVVSIHALLAECDSRSELSPEGTWSFNPRTPCGVRPGLFRLSPCHWCFNPRTPCGVRLQHITSGEKVKRFQSTHSLRSATADNERVTTRRKVSIHALLAECDWI